MSSTYISIDKLSITYIMGQIMSITKSWRIEMDTKTVYLQVHSKHLHIKTEGEEYRFRLSIGMKYLLELLQNPGRRYYAMNLYNALNPVPEEYRLLANQADIERVAQHLYSFDDLPPIYKADWQTVKEVGARLNFLIAQKALHLEYNDLAWLEEIEEEMDFLCRYLNDVMRKSGKLSTFMSSEKQVVRSVNKAIKRATSEIGKELPALGTYLDKRVYAWHLMYYNPGGEYHFDLG